MTKPFWLRDAGLAGFLAALFLIPVLVYGPLDREEYFNTAISVILNALSLQRHGWFLVWTDALGFGTPLPIGHNTAFHPLFWLWPFVPFSVLLSLYWWLHTGIAAFFFGRLLKL